MHKHRIHGLVHLRLCVASRLHLLLCTTAPTCVCFFFSGGGVPLFPKEIGFRCAVTWSVTPTVKRFLRFWNTQVQKVTKLETGLYTPQLAVDISSGQMRKWQQWSGRFYARRGFSRARQPKIAYGSDRRTCQQLGGQF